MLKFLRKYNRWILVVGGALLMVAFLLPQTVSQMGRGAGEGATYMRINDTKITGAQANRAKYEQYILEQLGLMDKQTNLDTWILQSYEAAREGLIGGPEDGQRLLRDVANLVAQRQAMQAFQSGIRDLDMSRLVENARSGVEQMALQSAASAHMTSDELYMALAKFRGVNRVESLYRAGPGALSIQREAIEGRHNFDQAIIDYVYLNSERLAPKIPKPDDAALAELFATYKGVKQGEGEYGIGYTLPPRVKIEWIALDRTEWEKQIPIDPIEVHKRFLAANPGKADAASSPEFETARPGIEAQIRKEKTDKILAEAVRTIRGEIAKSTMRLETAAAGEYFVLPPDWAAPSLESIRDTVAERIKTTSGISVTPPTVTVMNSWQDRTALFGARNIGRAYLTRGNARILFADLSLRAKEIAPANDLGIQERVPFGPIEDQSGNMYFFTVLAGRAESPPDSWEEIRDRLTTDYQRLEAFKQLQADAPSLRQRAIASGIEGIANDRTFLDPEAIDPFQRIPKVARDIRITRQDPIPFDIDTPQLRNEVMDTAEKLDPLKPVSEADAAVTTLAVPLPSKLAVAVIRITGFMPMTVEKMRQRDRELAGMAAQDAFKDLTDDPFTLASYLKRYRVDTEERKVSEQLAKEAEEAAGK
ncbi:MAG: hypothetical protein KF745_11565 [Phycisphaeraceae bacterium]|nr:hypothetical protein [Phycisphaeraceae bacterium]